MANFGTMTKPFHAGRSAHSGVMAARLAQAGFSASADALEHPQGFLAAVSPAGEVDRAAPADRLGERWRILETGLSVKKYPACYCTHRAIDGMLDLQRDQRMRDDEVESITVELSENYATILRNHRPTTGLSAKFSIEFALSAAIIAQRVGLRELTDEFVTRPDVQALMQKVAVRTTTDYDPDSPGAAKADWSEIRLRDGRVLATERVRRARGHADLPLSEADLFAKFEDCLQAGHSAIAAPLLFERLQSMEQRQARALTALH